MERVMVMVTVAKLQCKPRLKRGIKTAGTRNKQREVQEVGVPAAIEAEGPSLSN